MLQKDSTPCSRNPWPTARADVSQSIDNPLFYFNTGIFVTARRQASADLVFHSMVAKKNTNSILSTFLQNITNFSKTSKIKIGRHRKKNVQRQTTISTWLLLHTVGRCGRISCLEIQTWVGQNPRCWCLFSPAFGQCHIMRRCEKGMWENDG